MSDKDLAAAIVCLIVAKRQKRKRRIWTKGWLMKRSIYNNKRLLKDLELTELKDFKNYMRMDPIKFRQLIQLVKPLIEKTNTVMREAISPFQRLAITLRYLATGNTFEDLKFSTAISPQSLGKIVIETCEAIIQVLKDYIKVRK
ncbi:unnamed protein product [Euphydryas editha]|uniref:Nuclease HARBI1 n=1 Tax=Euphydryas editha TaxID=104508 RepID=A0AAU9TQ35_EUPED|nr:unnamed protein product [Euphydryas editha]